RRPPGTALLRRGRPALWQLGPPIGGADAPVPAPRAQPLSRGVSFRTVRSAHTMRSPGADQPAPTAPPINSPTGAGPVADRGPYRGRAGRRPACPRPGGLAATGPAPGGGAEAGASRRPVTTSVRT